jgi:hypothetical protein
MQTMKLRKQFLTALAIVPLMLFGCSSSEEAPPPEDTSSGGGGGDSSGDRDCSQFTNEVDIKECEVWNSMH